MSVEWTAFDFQEDLAALIEPELAGFAPTPRVLTYFPSPDEPLTDSIILGHTISDDKEQSTMQASRPSHDETVTVESQIRVVRPSAGEGPSRAARHRARELLAVVDTQVRSNAPSVGAQTLTANVASRVLSQFAWSSGQNVPVRVALLEFQIVYRARTRSDA